MWLQGNDGKTGAPFLIEVDGGVFDTQAGRPVRIMFLGDSNFQGSNGDSTGFVDGLRCAVYNYLRSFRSDFDFVGTLAHAPETSDYGLWFHEGHTGFKIADLTGAFAGYVATSGVGAPDLIVDEIGVNDVANGRTLAQMQADRAALDAQIKLSAPLAKRLSFGVRPIADGTTTHANLAAWQAQIASFNTWMQTTYGATQGLNPPVQFQNLPALGKGDFQTDGIHWNQQAQGYIGELLGKQIQALLGPLATPPTPRGFRMRLPWASTLLPTTADTVTIANSGFAPQNATGSLIFALDVYPLVLDDGALHNLATYGTYGANNFWAIYQQGEACRVYFNAAGGTIFGGSGNGSSEVCLRVNQWHRIVMIVDAITLTIGLYVNGRLVGLVQGLPAWNVAAGQSLVLGSQTFTGCPGYYSRVTAYQGLVPRPGSMAALQLVESDYYAGSSMIVGGGSAKYDLNTTLAGLYNDPAATLGGAAAAASAWPSGTPLRPWEVPIGPATPQVPTTALTIATTGNTSLTATQAHQPLIDVQTVTLTGAVTITLPNIPGEWDVDLSKVTLGGFTVAFKSGSATSAVLSPTATDQIVRVRTTGNNGVSVNL